MLSSCPVNVDRRGWPQGGRFIRALAPIVGLVLVAVVLYNATTVDRVPPSFQVKLSAIQPGGNLAQTLTSIDVVFTEEVQRNTAQRAFSMQAVDPAGALVSGSFHWQGLTMIFTPSEKLPLDTTFKVHLASGIEDLAGNAQQKSQDLSFTTVGAPIVSSTVPAENAAAVAVDSVIQITFDRNMDTQKVIDGLSVTPEVSYSASWNGPTLNIKPTHSLNYDTVYTVRIGDPAVDTDGTRLALYQMSFTTVNIGLVVSDLIPASSVAGVSVASPIAVIFDGPIDTSSIEGAISLTPPVSGAISVTTLPSDQAPSAAPTPSASPSAEQTTGNVLLFTPASPLAAHTTYTVTLGSGVRRTDGEAATGRTWEFTTGEPPVSGQNQIVFLSGRTGVPNVWIMNPDGSNQRQLTSELVPVTGFDVSGDGSTIAFTAGGIVKRMSMNGGGVQVMTQDGNYEYAPTFTPDGTGLLVARRDASGADQGYWLLPLVSGADARQLTTDGAAPIGSDVLVGDGLAGVPGEPAWASRTAFSSDGKSMLLVRGGDNRVELVDITQTKVPIIEQTSEGQQLIGNSRPVWDAMDNAFYLVASADNGTTWSCYRIGLDGAVSEVGPSAADMAVDAQGHVAEILETAKGSFHLAYSANASTQPSNSLTTQATWSDSSPSFSPDGSHIVFSRVVAQNPKVSAGIWIVGSDGNGLINLSLDGSYPRWLP